MKKTIGDLPVLFNEKENCCGCSACYAICPVEAISMEPDEEGFLYPAVDAGKCIRCYKCLAVCRFKEEQRIKGYYSRGICG
ncbi:MAG: 4Fe-4S dicluster domain-containing protein [Oscillospiraceae bacterium]|nr:4Fe-4S dicluster domain-containing protein [Oscillospiraceae bacterium]